MPKAKGYGKRKVRKTKQEFRKTIYGFTRKNRRRLKKQCRRDKRGWNR